MRDTNFGEIAAMRKPTGDWAMNRKRLRLKFPVDLLIQILLGVLIGFLHNYGGVDAIVVRTCLAFLILVASLNFL